MALPSGMMWRTSPAGQWLTRLAGSAAFWVTLALLIDMLLVLTLGRIFRGSGSRTVFNPNCRSDNARLDHHQLDLVFVWEVRLLLASQPPCRSLAPACHFFAPLPDGGRLESLAD